MHDQQAEALGRLVRRFAPHRDTGDFELVMIRRGREPGPKHLVVIARNVDDLGAASGVLQDRAHDPIMMHVPEPVLTEPPSVDHIADKKQFLATDTFEEVSQEIAAATARPQVSVRDEYRPISER